MIFLGNKEQVELLIRYGAAVNAIDKSHPSPLQRAILSMTFQKKKLSYKSRDFFLNSNHLLFNSEEDTSLVELLLKNGADPKIPFKNNLNALDDAVFAGNYEFCMKISKTFLRSHAQLII